MRLLLAAGADQTLKSKRGKTAMSLAKIARQTGHPDVVLSAVVAGSSCSESLNGSLSKKYWSITMQEVQKDRAPFLVRVVEPVP